MHSVIHHQKSDSNGKGKYTSRRQHSYAPIRNGLGVPGVNRFRDTDMVIIRNKYTKEIVDLECGLPAVTGLQASLSFSCSTTFNRQLAVKEFAQRIKVQELVGHTVQKRNWKGIVIALVVIIAVCSLIVATIILLSNKDDEEPVKSKFTFEDFMSRKYAPKSFSFKWAKGNDAFYYRNDDGAVLKYNCSTNITIMIMDNSTFKELNASRYTISPDEGFALLPYDIENIYRHSTRAKYKVVNLNTKEEKNLEGPDGIEFQYVSWSPNYDGLVFVQNNDVYYRANLFTGNDAFRVTDTGIPDEIFNGVPDWVFEEEILSTDNAIWWSPSGQYFLYASFNDSEVGRYDLTYYGPASNQYVDNKKLLYPKTGTTNPTFSLHIFQTATNTSVQINPPVTFKDINHYFTTVSWKDNENVMITWLNRAQNQSIFTMCSATNGSCFENYVYIAHSGWAKVDIATTFSADSSHYFMILPQLEGEAGFFRHIAMVDSSNRVNVASDNLGQKVFITTGLYDVISIDSYIPENNTIYYKAYKTGDPTSRHIYRTTTLTSDPSFQKPECITCSYSGDCDWTYADFSNSGKYYMLSCLGPAVPTHRLHSTISDTVVTFVDNKDVAEKLATKSLPRAKFLTIPLNENQVMHAKLLLPAGLKEDEVIKYNLLMSVYGGPDSQRVSKAFGLSWEEYLSSSHNLVIGYVDPRGSSGRGDAWRHANYRRLGTTEVDDTIVAGRYLTSLKYISRIKAIWGWSYGGYLTAAILGRGSGVFDCGISVAPVTDWKYYDTVYTERYMGLPDDNVAGYDYGKISKGVDNFKKSKFMIVHGTGDDNVHFQNTAQLARDLTEANVYFRSHFYTDQQHSINKGNSRKHLYNTLEDFLLQCYGGQSSHLDELNNADDDDDKDGE